MISKQLLTERYAPCQGLDVMSCKLQASSQNKNNCTLVTHKTGLESLLLDRVRKFSKNFNPTEELSDGVKEAELFANDSVTKETETHGPLHEDTSLEEVNVCERPRRPKQRLLVVANSLPVSAIRKGQDSWKLEISVDGLVNPLLGE